MKSSNLVLYLFLLINNAEAASFDCAKAKSTPEKLICSNQELSLLDDNLKVVFESAKAKSKDLTLFKEISRQQWNEREKSCRDYQCLKQWYLKQINYYENLYTQQNKLSTTRDSRSINVKSSESSETTNSLVVFLVFLLSIFGFSRYRKRKKYEKLQAEMLSSYLKNEKLQIEQVEFEQQKQEENNKRLADARNLDILNFESELQKYINILARNKLIKIAKDEYGFEDPSKWINEKNSFLRKLNYNSIQHPKYEGLSLEQQSSLIDFFIEKHKKHEILHLVSYKEDMSGVEYENFCADRLRAFGWSVKLTPGSGDQGVDILAEKNSYKIAIQCKKYQNPVGNAAVQEISSGIAYWGADFGVVVTNAGYTKSARELAVVQKIKLLHHEDLRDLEEILEI